MMKIMKNIGIILFSGAMIIACSKADNKATGKNSVPGEVSILVGPKENGGNGTILSSPTGMTVDRKGNVYVADMNTNRIVKITPDGKEIILTGKTDRENIKAVGLEMHSERSELDRTFNESLAAIASGKLNEGANDGAAKEATFNRPIGVAIDESGNLYVTDSGNRTIRKLTPKGVVTTIAGNARYEGGLDDGQGENARFSNPQYLAVDKSGSIYITEAYSNHAIRKITKDGVVTTLAGGIGKKGLDKLDRPSGITTDEGGTVYFADFGNHLIKKITPDGIVSVHAGSGSTGYLDGPAEHARFTAIVNIASDKLGNIYVIDSYHKVIRMISSQNFVITLPNQPKLINPRGIAVDESGNIYVSDTGNRSIYKINALDFSSSGGHAPEMDCDGPC